MILEKSIGHSNTRMEMSRFTIAAVALGIVTVAQWAGAQDSVNARIEVGAASDWVDTAVYAFKGERLIIRPSGSWSNGGANPQQTGPEGFRTIPSEHGLPLASLIGRIGGVVFDIGGGYDGIVPDTGQLDLRMNDNDYTDNFGGLSVTVQAIPARMPSLQGRSFEDAARIVARFHRSAQRFEAPSNYMAQGLIWTQSPHPGTDIRGVESIRLIVSRGPGPAVPMPDFTGYRFEDAVGELAKLAPHVLVRPESKDPSQERGLVFLPTSRNSIAWGTRSFCRECPRFL